MTKPSKAVIGLAALGACLCAAWADLVRERSLALRFAPQELIGANAPTIPEGNVRRPVEIIIHDARPPTELEIVGQGTDDEDRPFPWRATSSVAEFVKEVLSRVASGWGIRFQQSADSILTLRLARFFVTEKDQAVGSTYVSEVTLAFSLSDRSGSVLADGVGSGSTRRYGRKRSAENCNEVLSDALKEAFARVFDNKSLQAAWSDNPNLSRAPGQRLSTDGLLAEVIKLKDQGFSAEILIQYIGQKQLATPLTADDLLKWKDAGLPESVIKAAMGAAAVIETPAQ